MSNTLTRNEIHDLLAEMAELLKGDRQAAVWRAFLLKAADIAQDPTLDDDEDTVSEIANALHGYYQRNSRPISDLVIHRSEPDAMRAANEHFAELQDALFRGLPD